MKKLTLLLAALLLVIAACGDDDATTTTTTAPQPTTTAAAPTTTADDNATDTTAAASTTTEAPVTTVPGPANVLADAVVDCLGGDDVACDVAYMIAELGSDDEEIGETCGGRGLPDDQLFCSGYDFDSAADAPGDDPLLDELWDLCDAGSDEACLALWEWSPDGSAYETLASDLLFPEGGDNGGDALDLGELPPLDVAAMNSCEDIADGAIILFQAFIDILDTVDLAQMEDVTGDEPIFVQAEQAGTAMEDRAAALGCSDDGMQALLEARVDQLTATGFFGQMIIDGIMEDGLDFGGGE